MYCAYFLSRYHFNINSISIHNYSIYTLNGTIGNTENVFPYQNRNGKSSSFHIDQPGDPAGLSHHTCHTFSEDPHLLKLHMLYLFSESCHVLLDYSTKTRKR